MLTKADSTGSCWPLCWLNWYYLGRYRQILRPSFSQSQTPSAIPSTRMVLGPSGRCLKCSHTMKFGTAYRHVGTPAFPRLRGQDTNQERKALRNITYTLDHDMHTILKTKKTLDTIKVRFSFDQNDFSFNIRTWYMMQPEVEKFLQDTGASNIKDTFNVHV